MLNILIAEDEQAISNLIYINLTEEGYKCTSCENLEEITINGRNAIIGGGGLSVQVTPSVRYTFNTGVNTAISYEELIRVAESISVNQ